MPGTGKLFFDYHSRLNPHLRLPANHFLINPYAVSETIRVLEIFCNKYYNNSNKRILMLGINPGRFGAGITGIPFTDPVALGEQLGIANAFERQNELSCGFVYEFINAFGGPQKFYSRFLLSGVCPLGLLHGTKNCNYYDSPRLLKSTRLLIHESLTKHVAMNVRTDVVISLGKKNATHLEKINDELHLFKQIVTLDHPRYIMQYRLRSRHDYIMQYTRLMESLL